MALDIQLLRSSFALVAKREPELTKRFYGLLFERYPQARPLFRRSEPHVQERMLRDALVAVLEHLEDTAWLKRTLGGLGARHVGYGVTPQMYDWVGECLLATLAEVAGDAWTPDLAAQWTEAYGVLVSMMLASTPATSISDAVAQTLPA